MKLRNKKTGGIGEFGHLATSDGTIIVSNINDQDEWYEYKSLAELNADWEDYEEPKKFWYIFADVPRSLDCGDILEEDFKAVGNYFETKEEAEKAVEKLKAWKRLKDNGMRTYSFKREKRGIDLDYYTLTILAPRDKDSLDLLFGGEE